MIYVLSYLKKKKGKKNFYKVETAKFYEHQDAIYWKTLKEKEGCLDFKISTDF